MLIRHLCLSVTSWYENSNEEVQQNGRIVKKEDEKREEKPVQRSQTKSNTQEAQLGL